MDAGIFVARKGSIIKMADMLEISIILHQPNKHTGMALLFTLTTLSALLALSYANEAYQEEGLKQHNELRKKHKSPDMTLDPDLNAKAVTCAKYYVDKGKIDHSCPDKGDVGENLYQEMDTEAAPASSPATKSAIQSWYGELKDYDFENPTNATAKTGHFTQLVWAKSTKLGLGAYEDNGKKNTYVVALYTAPGNIMGEYQENVKKA